MFINHVFSTSVFSNLSFKLPSPEIISIVFTTTLSNLEALLVLADSVLSFFSTLSPKL